MHAGEEVGHVGNEILYDPQVRQRIDPHRLLDVADRLSAGDCVRAIDVPSLGLRSAAGLKSFALGAVFNFP
jgi:hypothetical protein